MIKLLLSIIFLASVSTTSIVYAEEEKLIKIYLDADRSRHTESAKSIEMGIKTAFSEINNTIQGHKIEFVALDHRGNSTRSKLNMDKAFKDPDGLLVIAGLHSPPLIKNRTYINENKMLTLVPWAAGGPITRYPSTDNWIFRLSVDDTKAGYKIANHAINQKSCENPALLLEQTPWGESNKKTMTSAIIKNNLEEPSIVWFNWGISEDSARIKLRSIIERGAECILFVGNSNDGISVTNAMISMEYQKRIPIYSHWGISGGNFAEKINAKKRKSIDLSFIQTCFSFISSPETKISKKAFVNAQNLFPNLKSPIDLKAPAGFIHAYDLGLILRQSLSQVSLTNDMAQNRLKLKNALENLTTPIEGLVKTYKKPFSTYNNDNKDAHEALGLDDFCMASYGDKNEIVVLQK